MKTRLSEFIDGELPAHDAEVLFNELKRSQNLRGCWREYHLIGDALKDETWLDGDITAAVMRALQDEPVVLAPALSGPGRMQRTLLALAATLAGVAVVGWVALAPQQAPAPTGALVAQREAVVAEPVRQASREMQNYLVAHQAQASSLQFRGGTENIRTVAATGTAMSK